MRNEAYAKGAHEAFSEVVEDLRRYGLNALADHYAERAKGMRYAAMRPTPSTEDRGDSPTIPIYRTSPAPDQPATGKFISQKQDEARAAEFDIVNGYVQRIGEKIGP